MIEKTQVDKVLKRILKKQKSKAPLELIVGYESSGRRKTIKQLKKLGKITNNFEFLPYTSLKCDYSVGRNLSEFLFNRNFNVEFRKTFTQLDYVTSVEVASMVTNIPVKVKSRQEVKSKLRNLWNLENIGAYEAQRIGSGNGTKVGIIDSGVDYNHPELIENFEENKGYDFVRNNDEPKDQNGHGTHVAGIIAGSSTGVAPTAITYALRVLDKNGRASETNVMRALEWAVVNDLDIVNLSLGGTSASGAFREMFEYIYGQGILAVAAAGNNGFGPSYPAAFDETVIAVPAVDKNNNHPSFSNIYETNDISAPGVDIWSCYPGNNYVELTGTSMAAPHVTGTLAIMAAFNNNPDTVESALINTAQKLDSSPWKTKPTFGAGLVRADKAVEKVYSSRDLRNMLLGNQKSLISTVKTMVW